MLSGEYTHNLDSKGRIIIPVKLREQLGENFVITKGFDNCLFIYSKNEWYKFENKLSTLNMMNRDARSLIRFFVGSSIDLTIDIMGRILIPATLRKYASLTREVVLVGIVNRIEIWNKDLWNKLNNNITNNMDDIVSRLDEIGLNL